MEYSTVTEPNACNRESKTCDRGIARHGSDTTGRDLALFSVILSNIRQISASENRTVTRVRVRASGAVVIPRGAIMGTPNVFCTRRRLSFSFILGDPKSLCGLLVAAGACD